MGGGGPPLHDGCGVVGVIHVSNCGPTLCRPCHSQVTNRYRFGTPGLVYASSLRDARVQRIGAAGVSPLAAALISVARRARFANRFNTAVPVRNNLLLIKPS